MFLKTLLTLFRTCGPVKPQLSLTLQEQIAAKSSDQEAGIENLFNLLVDVHIYCLVLFTANE